MDNEDRKFCVYLHRRLDNNEVFYVGQGVTETRPNYSVRRNKRWNAIVNAFGFYSDIYKDCLTKEEALVLEKQLILELKDLVVNQVWASSETSDLNFENFNELFYINPNSKTGLSRKVDRYAKNTLIVAKDSDAGFINSSGYYSVTVDWKMYLVHRIIYLLHHGDISSSLVVDHIDNTRTNNKIENLRAVTHKQNQQNRKLDSRTTSGVSGVSVKSRGIVEATISTTTKRLSKTFSISKYGYDEAFRLACEWRKQMEELHYNKE
jgi:hypothetical protein